MEDIRSVQMSTQERNEFLEHGGTGVVSFALGADEPPYSLPVSYGYDVSAGDFYFRLAYGPGTGKQDVVDEGGPISFVAYEHTDAGWRSVVATGKLEEITEVDIGSTISEAMRRIEIPLVDVFERDPGELTFRFFRFDPDDLWGRKEAHSDQ